MDAADAGCVLFALRSSSKVRRSHMHTHHTAPSTRPDLDSSWTDTLDRLQAFVAARVDDRELAADITQDVIVRSIASGALDRVDNPAAWLYRSARNAVIDHYRTRRSHQPLTDLDAWPDPDEFDDRPNDATRELSRCLHPQPERPWCAWTSMATPSSEPPAIWASPCRG